MTNWINLEFQTTLISLAPPGFLDLSTALGQRLRLAVSREEKWYPRILRVICLYQVGINAFLKIESMYPISLPPGGKLN